MKWHLLAATIAAVLVGNTAMADGGVITSGSKGGGYEAKAHKMNKMLRGRDHKMTVKNSKGSIENLKRLHAGEADIGFVQADALAWFLSKNPAADNTIEIIGELGEECIYLAVNKDGKVGEEDDLGNKGVKIDVQRNGSGSAVSWEYLRTLEEDYKAAVVSNQGGTRALGKLAANKIDAVLWVQDPAKLDTKLLSTVNKNDKIELINLNDYSLNNKLPNGEPVYEFKKPPTAEGMWINNNVEMPCMKALVVARSEADGDMLDDVADIMLNYASNLQ